MENITQIRDPEILATTYWLTRTDGSSRISFELTGEEMVSTCCPNCSEEHSITFDHFLEIMRDGELYGTSVYCRHCSKIKLERNY